MEAPKEEIEVKSEEKTQEPVEENPAPAVKGACRSAVLISVEEEKGEEDEIPSKEVESVEEKPEVEDEESLVMACEVLRRLLRA